MSEHELWNELGNLYFMSGAYNQAVYAYHRSIQLDSNFGRPYSNLALTYVQQGKYEEAIELYRSSIELLADNKEKAISWSRLGNVYRHLKEYTKAVVAYQEADELDPQSTADNLSQPTEDILPQPAEDILPQSEADNLPQPAEDILPQSIADNLSQPTEDILPQTAQDNLPQPAEDILPQSEADNLPQAVEDILLQSEADNLPQAAKDILPQSTADILDQTIVDIQTQSADELSPCIEALPQSEEIIEVHEESEQINDAVPEVLSVEDNQLFSPEEVSDQINDAIPEAPSVDENQVFSPESVMEADPISCDDDDSGGVYHEELPAESPLNPTLPAELELHLEEELLQAGTDSEPNQVSLDASTASWALANPSRYQADISESPESGPLTIWGEPEVKNEDWDLFPAPDPDPDVDLPETEGDGLTRWIPIPEEEPGIELETLEQIEKPQEEVSEPVVSHSPFYQVIETVDYLESSSDDLQQKPAVVSEQSPKDIPEQIVTSFPFVLPSMSSVHRTEEYSEPTVQLIEVEVEERPSAITPSQLIPEFVLAEKSEDQRLETQTENNETQLDTGRLEPESQEMQELEVSIAKFKRAVQVNPHNAYAWDALGTLYKSAGLYKDAILAYQQATSIDPPKALYYHNLGLVYACEGRDEDAIGAFQKVIEIDPDYSLAHATLGGYYRKMGLEELAQKHIGKAMKNIFDSENEYNRACLEAICGNADHAIELLRVALRNKQTYVDWILRDPDLDFIRQDPRFKQLLSDYTR